MTRAGAGVRTGVGVLVGVDDGVALGIAVDVRVGTGVPVGLGVGDGVARATVAWRLGGGVTWAPGDGVMPLAPNTVPSQAVRVAPRPSRIASKGRSAAGANRLLDNGNPPQDEMVADGLTTRIGHWQAGAGRQ